MSRGAPSDEELRVPRPNKRTDHRVVFQGTTVEKGWADCLAAARNATVEAWDALTSAPGDRSPRQYQLRGDEAVVMHQGVSLPQWEYKITDGGRILYLLDERPVLKNGKALWAGTVIIVEASPGHPKRTEKVRGSRKSPGRR